MQLYKKGEPNTNTLFLLGGIHGNERGAYLAASIVATKYHVAKGSLWVVPNINMPSITHNQRGYNGDMNRKFNHIDANDADFERVTKLKNYITSPNIKFLLNLHDGSGFYRPITQNNKYAPYRWGQCIVIDQKILKNNKYGNLYKMASKAVNGVNKIITNNNHKFRVKNTKTGLGNVSMSKSLSWFALNNNKPSITSETSFELDVFTRVMHHLKVIESVMDAWGIEYTKDFTLSVNSIKNVLYSGLDIVIDDVLLSLRDIKPNLKRIPFVSQTPKYTSSNPLISLQQIDQAYKVLYGNEVLTSIEPEYMNKSLTNMPIYIDIDNEFQEIVYMPSVVEVKDSFSIVDNKYYRINVIGYVNHNSTKETGVEIHKNDFIQDYAIDKYSTTYRVEVYDKRNNDFVGMFLIKYDN